MLRLLRLAPLACLFLLTAALVRADDDVVAKPDTPPAPVRTPPPEYPMELRRAGTAGMVAVAVVVDANGDVTSAEVNKSTHPDFEAPALEAVKKWKFKPAQLGGKPVKVRVVIPLRFNISK